MSDFHGLFDLGPGKGEDVEIRAGGRPVHVPRIGEEVGGAPEQLDAGSRLFVLENLDDLIEMGVAFLEVLAFRSDVAIVKRVERNAEFFEELESGLGSAWALATELVPSSQGRRAVPAPNGSERTLQNVCQ